MSPTALLVGLGFVVLVVITLLATRLANPRSRLDRAAKAAGLPLTPAVEKTLVVSTRAEVWWIGLGALAALVIAEILMVFVGASAAIQVVYVCFTAILAGVGLTAAVSAFVAERRRQVGGPVRVARLRAVTVSDYRSPFNQWAPRIAVAIAVIGLVARSVGSPHGVADVPTFYFIYIAVTTALAVLNEVVAPRLIRRGQPAGSELELAWDDSFRSRALISLAYTPLLLGFYFGVLSATYVPATHQVGDHAGAIAGSLFSLAGTLFFLVWAIVNAATAPQQRYLRRLWPDLANRHDAGSGDRYRGEVADHASLNDRKLTKRTAKNGAAS